MRRRRRTGAHTLRRGTSRIPEVESGRPAHRPEHPAPRHVRRLRKLFLVDVKDGSSRKSGPIPGHALRRRMALRRRDRLFRVRIVRRQAARAARAFRENIRTLRRQPLFWVDASGITVDLLPDGRVIFDVMSGRQNLREYALEGHGPPRWITHGTINDRQPVFAPGGEWVVFSSNRSGNLDLWAGPPPHGRRAEHHGRPSGRLGSGASPDGRSLLWSFESERKPGSLGLQPGRYGRAPGHP